MTLKRDLDKAYQKKVIETLEDRVRTAAIIADNKLVEMTPVDTGRARSNWIPTLNSPAEGTRAPGERVDIGPALSSYRINDTILLTNNLPYIQRLNDGYSTQAPAGFVENALSIAKRAVEL